LAQATLQNSKAPQRNGVSGCTVQLQPGQQQPERMALMKHVLNM